MRTLVVASQKGGSGKTTLSGHLAVEAERAGAGPVAMIDTDPQGSLSHWWNARKKETPIFVKVGSLELEDVLTELQAAGVKLAVIDTPPAITGSITKVMACADLVIVPTRPSPHDLRAVGATADIADELQKPLIFVLNDATPRARITAEAAVALSQHGTVAPVTLHHRIDFVASMVDGRTAGEVVEQSKSSDEVRALWTYVAGRLRRLPARSRTDDTAPAPMFLASPPSLVADDEEEDAALFEAPPVVGPETMVSEPAPRQDFVEPDPPQEPRLSKDSERRSGPDRRAINPDQRTFGAVERRTSHPFGRRGSERTL